jgi:hypothetical protein
MVGGIVVGMSVGAGVGGSVGGTQFEASVGVGVGGTVGTGVGAFVGDSVQEPSPIAHDKVVDPATSQLSPKRVCTLPQEASHSVYDSSQPHTPASQNSSCESGYGHSDPSPLCAEVMLYVFLQTLSSQSDHTPTQSTDWIVGGIVVGKSVGAGVGGTGAFVGGAVTGSVGAGVGDNVVGMRVGIGVGPGVGSAVQAPSPTGHDTATEPA